MEQWTFVRVAKHVWLQPECETSIYSSDTLKIKCQEVAIDGLDVTPPTDRLKANCAAAVWWPGAEVASPR